MRTTSKWGRPQNEDDLKNEDELKNQDDLKNEDDIKNENDLKNKDDPPQLKRILPAIFFNDLSPRQPLDNWY